MSCDHRYPFPQVFLVDGGGSPGNPAQPPSLVPCWTSPPAQERARSHGKSGGFTRVSPCLTMIVLLLFLLVFAALGFEAYQIYNMKTEMRQMRQGEPVTEFNMAQKQIGLYEPELHDEDKDDRTAAHVTGQIQKEIFHKTLRWELKGGRPFLSGGVTYQIEDGSLRVNESGFYHVYSRVELIFKGCSSASSFFHSVFVRRARPLPPLTLMEAHRDGFCPQQLEHPWTSDSFLASAVKLQKYDRVFVNVSHPKYLSHDHYANFFGLYKI
ncbi:tumor necrosis factor ligand superfamily member 6 [Hippoglossus hippoglossus]|uniref:tumor necrosis factor ligand superfamily member 6 n=1 Tax=Hippoglossus hippoglossus TaxID=8267 RepID=UPI00148C2B2B|nr:tumor necrosis factor ligand superfamily member 6 [Hippoglossus hippoglossus]